MGAMRIGVLLVLLVACGGADSDPDESASETTAAGVTGQTTAAETTAADEGCAHVIDGEIDAGDDGTYTVSATVSSADTGEEKYADAWEVRSADGTVLGVRELLHPHVDEQPFTRSLSDVAIPDDVETVTLAARDSVEGFCGDVFEVAVP